MQSPIQFFRLAVSIVVACTFVAMTSNAQTRVYTLDADFDEGTLVNVNHDAPNNDQLQLDSKATPFNFIWVSVSSEGTVVKIDTETGAVLGEYRTHPTLSGSSANPSRTTVDNDGSVWVANRGGNPGTVTHVGLLENLQCEDRHGPGGLGLPDGVIQTSTGLSDVLGWTTSGAPRGVGDAVDECIVHHTAVNSTGGTRHISVAANNDVWVSSTSTRNFDLIKGGKYDVPLSGTIIRAETGVGFGGYGGLIDGNGVIWSARPLLRWDTSLPLTGGNGDPDPPFGLNIGPPLSGTNWAGQHSPDSYGLCIDSQGNVWNTELYNNRIHKYRPDGKHLGVFSHGSNSAQGCVVDGNDDVWVAHSLIGPSNTVGHILNDGTFVGNVTVGSGPTGVAVDAAGKIWATNYNGQTASRIDPTLGVAGAVDLTTVNLGGLLYNYSDMTGSTLIAPPNAGTWTVVYNSGVPDVEWGLVTWSADEPSDATIAVFASSSADGISFGGEQTVAQNFDLTVADGQYLKIIVSFTRATTGETPVLYDLTINRPPVCDDAIAGPAELWPPKHDMRPIEVLGVTDPDGDEVTILITGITQDEHVDSYGDGTFAPDGAGVGTDLAEVRAERSGTKKNPGNGRVYEIGFIASDASGGECKATVNVCVPHDMRKGHVCFDDGQIYDSTVIPMARIDALAEAVSQSRDAPLSYGLDEAYPNPFNPVTTIRFAVPEAGELDIAVYDMIGRRVRSVVSGVVDAGVHEATIEASDLPSGVYIVRMDTEERSFVRQIVLLK